jgi:hypothetical protein
MTTLKSTTVPKAEKKAAISGSVACAAARRSAHPIQRESGLRRLGATKLARPPLALAPPRSRTRLAGQAADEGPAVGGDACGAGAIRPQWATALRRADVHGAPVHVQLAARLDGRGGSLVSKGDEGVALGAPSARVRDELRRSKKRSGQCNGCHSAARSAAAPRPVPPRCSLAPPATCRARDHGRARTRTLVSVPKG